MAKIRQGFVSNSSSSSFIVAFPKDMVVTPEAIKDYVFGDWKYIQYYDYCIDVLSAAEAIYEQMKNQKPNDLEYIGSACIGWIDGGPEPDDFRKGKDFDWDGYREARDAHLVKFIKEFMSKADGKDVYAFEFGDRNGECALEHGGTFERVLHEQISNH